MMHRTNFASSALVAVLLASITGCLQPADTACTQGPAGVAPPTSSTAFYVGQGDPYASGPLAIRTVDIARCERDAPVSMLIVAPETPGAYPLVVFQHGFVTRNAAYSEILSHLAGHGFVVVAPQMYEPGLAALLGHPTAAEEARTAALLLDWLPAGLAEVLGYAPAAGRLGLAGHSRGGKVVWLVLTADPSRAHAVAGIDPVDGTGGPLGNQTRVVQGSIGFSLPALILGTGLAGDCAPVGDNHERFYAASTTPAWHVVVPNQGHADMLDEPTAMAAAGLCPGGPDRAGMRRLTAGLLVAFFRASLQGDTSAYAYLTNTTAAPLPIEVEAK